jgi:lipid-binding SYLF domain-containing protein
MRTWTAVSKALCVLCVVLLAQVTLPTTGHAATAQAINASADQTMALFRQQFPGADAYLRDARGVLIFPQVIQAGIGIGGEYGEGVMRIADHDAGYYSIAAGSWGFQFGVQAKSIVVLFMDGQALRHFQEKTAMGNNFNVGIDGSIAIINIGGQASVNSATINRPIMGFVFNQKGLMYNLSLQGAKITQIQR